MKIREIWGMIKDSFIDISDDTMIAEERNREFRRNQSVFGYGGRFGRRSDSAALFQVLFPDIVGFVLGTAIAKLLGGSGFIYPVLGFVCAIAFGSWYSVFRQKMQWKYALIRHLLISFGGALIVLLLIILSTV